MSTKCSLKLNLENSVFFIIDVAVAIVTASPENVVLSQQIMSPSNDEIEALLRFEFI